MRTRADNAPRYYRYYTSVIYVQQNPAKCLPVKFLERTYILTPLYKKNIYTRFENNTAESL